MCPSGGHERSGRNSTRRQVQEAFASDTTQLLEAQDRVTDARETRGWRRPAVPASGPTSVSSKRAQLPKRQPALCLRDRGAGARTETRLWAAKDATSEDSPEALDHEVPCIRRAEFIRELFHTYSYSEFMISDGYRIVPQKSQKAFEPHYGIILVFR